MTIKSLLRHGFARIAARRRCRLRRRPRSRSAILRIIPAAEAEPAAKIAALGVPYFAFGHFAWPRFEREH